MGYQWYSWSTTWLLIWVYLIFGIPQNNNQIVGRRIIFSDTLGLKWRISGTRADLITSCGVWNSAASADPILATLALLSTLVLPKEWWDPILNLEVLRGVEYWEEVSDFCWLSNHGCWMQAISEIKWWQPMAGLNAKSWRAGEVCYSLNVVGK